MNTLTFRPSPYAAFMQASEVDANGLTFHFEVGGNPEHPTILLIMGLGAQMLLWTETFCQQLIERGFRVIRFDNRDIGLSSKIRKKNQRLNTLKLMGRFSLGLSSQGSPYTLYDMAEDASQLIDALKLDSVHVIGASMGGMIAQILAAKHPEQVKTLNLLFTSNNRALLPPPGYRQLQALIGKPKGHDEDSMVEHAAHLVTMIGSPQHLNLDKSRAFTRVLYRRSFSPAGVMQQYLAVLCTGSLAAIDRQIRKPTLILHGSCDKLVTPAHGRAVAKAIHGAKFKLIDGMGHDIPDALAPKLAELYTRHMQLHG